MQSIRTGLLVVLALSGMLAGAGPAAADPFRSIAEASGYPIPPVGTRVDYTEGYSVTVVDVWAEAGAVTIDSIHPVYGHERITHAYGIEWYDWAAVEDGELVNRTRYLFNAAILADAWPLTDGFRAEYDSMELYSDPTADPARPITGTIEVQAAAPLDTPLGRLPVFMVRLTLNLGPDDTGTIMINTYTRWFSPDFGLPLKVEQSFRYGWEAPTVDVYDLVGMSIPAE